ncbi:ABC transporter ATP-binding protein [Qiania dongpingensis]|uniref:ABC transporter ATP-binding protein n=1 Tax=Qiania dongpingensis TaxID=2763669 RepID=A0A7G9G7Y3_9FIRM|nr:ABC transporter ATP-binding protein [Qiania dongpingensis]
MLEVRHLNKQYSSGLLKRQVVNPVQDISFQIEAGSTFGLMGNSGCGKTTLSRIILRLIPADSGQILFEGTDITKCSGKYLKTIRPKMQMIFQHPESSLNPLMNIKNNLLEPFKIHKLYDKERREEEIREKLALVGLPEGLLSHYPHEISGGEAQRVVIARALTMDVRFFVLDEPTSMLDVSVQAQIMNLFRDLQKRLGLTYLFISHDLEVVRWISTHIGFMNGGKLVEQGKTEEIIENPKIEFTKNFINSF